MLCPCRTVLCVLRLLCRYLVALGDPGQPLSAEMFVFACNCLAVIKAATQVISCYFGCSFRDFWVGEALMFVRKITNWSAGGTSRK